jgi:hypothetical protein
MDQTCYMWMADLTFCMKWMRFEDLTKDGWAGDLFSNKNLPLLSNHSRDHREWCAYFFFLNLSAHNEIIVINSASSMMFLERLSKRLSESMSSVTSGWHTSLFPSFLAFPFPPYHIPHPSPNRSFASRAFRAGCSGTRPLSADLSTCFGSKLIFVLFC